MLSNLIKQLLNVELNIFRDNGKNVNFDNISLLFQPDTINYAKRQNKLWNLGANLIEISDEE